MAKRTEDTKALKAEIRALKRDVKARDKLLGEIVESHTAIRAEYDEANKARVDSDDSAELAEQEAKNEAWRADEAETDRDTYLEALKGARRAVGHTDICATVRRPAPPYDFCDCGRGPIA